MKLLVKGTYLLFLVSLVLSNDIITDEQVEEAFKELDRQLNDREDLKKLIQEVKDEVKQKPDFAKNTLGMAKALALAVPKLRSNNPLSIADGALSVISGIAEHFPGGMAVATVASLVSSVIGLFTPTKVSLYNQIVTKPRMSTQHISILGVSPRDLSGNSKIYAAQRYQRVLN